ncbi:hypothetical protein BAU07_06380 [Bordetella flabilis]|uniref:Uncharacterized protein n=2 Tax=Bordetella flabilis TaxID=463014 RepID=A0A193GAY9_9BORD|nr:hypothetical protein BAU07_06380 [Bordetella flabilis]
MLVQETGSIAALNRATGKQDRDSTYSQILNGSISSATGRPKEMGATMARKIEEHLGKPLGWMDTDPEDARTKWPFIDIAPSRFSALPDRVKGRIEERVLAMIEEWERSEDTMTELQKAVSEMEGIAASAHSRKRRA